MKKTLADESLVKMSSKILVTSYTILRKKMNKMSELRSALKLGSTPLMGKSFLRMFHQFPLYERILTTMNYVCEKTIFWMIYPLDLARFYKNILIKN